MLARIRKALVAGVGAGIGAAAGVIGKAVAEGALDDTAWQQGLGAFIVVGVLVGRATWRVPNERPLATGGIVEGPIGPIGE